jgi:hypothetical protein
LPSRARKENDKFDHPYQEMAPAYPRNEWIKASDKTGNKIATE